MTLLRPRVYLCTADAYVIQKPGNQCTPDTILGTLAECESARASLEPSAPAVIGESSAFTPKGCSRFKGEWYFNSHPTGKADDESELACKGKEAPPEGRTPAPERPTGTLSLEYCMSPIINRNLSVHYHTCLVSLSNHNIIAVTSRAHKFTPYTHIVQSLCSTCSNHYYIC